ncbi:TPA: CopG family ribbon-helix-helix protein [Salmonella enterica]|nr:CopG family ribbon-helix-helix protein [Salmonella enterica]
MPLSSTTLKLDDELKARVRKLADTRDRTPHYLMVAAITEYVAREEQRESFKQEAINSWREFQETGLHLTNKEVSDWLNAWGSEGEEDAPACHR